jgi:hypothetical protein
MLRRPLLPGRRDVLRRAMLPDRQLVLRRPVLSGGEHLLQQPDVLCGGPGVLWRRLLRSRLVLLSHGRRLLPARHHLLRRQRLLYVDPDLLQQPGLLRRRPGVLRRRLLRGGLHLLRQPHLLPF